MLKWLLCFFLFEFALAAATTTVTGTYSTMEGRPANGIIVIEVSRAFVAYDGKNVPVQKKTYQIKNGSFVIALEPNSWSTPASFYIVSTAIDGGAVEPTMWSVPVSATAVTVASVVIAAPPAIDQTIPPQQIRVSGATTGDILQFNGTQYGPAALAPGGVSSVNGSTGAVTGVELTANKGAASGYAPLDSGSKLPVGNIPSGIDAIKLANGSVSNTELQYLNGANSNVQTQLNAKVSKGDGIYAEDYCTTPGIYDQSCIINAAAAVGVTGSVILSSHTFTLGSKITLTSKTNFTLVGLPGAKITLASGLNDDGISFITCTNIQVTGIAFDGNQAGQSGTSHILSFTNEALGFIKIDHNTFLNAQDAALFLTDNQFSVTENLFVQANRFDSSAGYDIKSTYTGATFWNLGKKILDNIFVNSAINSTLATSTMFITGYGYLSLNNNTFFQPIYNPTLTCVATLNTQFQHASVYGNLVQGGFGAFNAMSLCYTGGASASYVTLEPSTSISESYLINAVGCVGNTPYPLVTMINGTLDCSLPEFGGMASTNVNGTDHILVFRIKIPTSFDFGTIFSIRQYYYNKDATGAANVISFATDFACVKNGSSGMALDSLTWTNFGSTNSGGAGSYQNKLLGFDNSIAGTVLTAAGCTADDTFLYRFRRTYFSGGSAYLGTSVFTGIRVSFTRNIP